MSPQIIMTVGLPASGKSTWAKQWVAEKPEERKRVNRDDLRAMLDCGKWTPDNEQFAIKVRDGIMLQALRAGKSVVIDDTNLRKNNYTKLCDTIERAGLSAMVMEKPFPIELSEAILRDSKREAPVGEAVIKSMWEKYIGKHGTLHSPRANVIGTPRDKAEPFPRDEKIPDAIICDLDGTAAFMGDRSPFDASRCDELDSPNPAVIQCVKAMHAQGLRIIFMTGREDKDRDATERFIAKWIKTCALMSHGRAPASVDVITIPHDLYMRPTGDGRKDTIVKRELFDNHVMGRYNVLFALDDRDRVVRMWRDMGISCFQVNDYA